MAPGASDADAHLRGGTPPEGAGSCLRLPQPARAHGPRGPAAPAAARGLRGGDRGGDPDPRSAGLPRRRPVRAAVRRRQAGARAVGQRAHPARHCSPAGSIATSPRRRWPRSPTRPRARDEPESELDRALALLRRRFPEPAAGPARPQPRAGHAAAQGLRVRAGARRPGRPRPRRLSESRPRWTALSWRAGSRATSARGARRARPTLEAAVHATGDVQPGAVQPRPSSAWPAIAAFWEGSREGPEEQFTLDWALGCRRGQRRRRPGRGGLRRPAGAPLPRPVDRYPRGRRSLQRVRRVALLPRAAAQYRPRHLTALSGRSGR